MSDSVFGCYWYAARRFVYFVTQCRLHILIVASEPTVIIATRTRTVPTWSNSFGSVHTMQAEPAMSDTTSTFEDVLTSEWGIWGQQDNIQLCEVRFAIAYVGDSMLFSASPFVTYKVCPRAATSTTHDVGETNSSYCNQGKSSNPSCLRPFSCYNIQF
jgi:hypothetical protein